MKSNIADASIASTNLINAMHSINRETERISDNPQAVAHFEECKKLRRRILRYVRYFSYFDVRECQLTREADSPCGPRAVSWQLAQRQ